MLSDIADQYDDLSNVRSCWTLQAKKLLANLKVKDMHRTVGEVGCGTGTALYALASRSPSTVRFIGIEPAARMRRRASALTKPLPNVSIRDGTFEELPLEDSSVDYVFSIDAISIGCQTCPRL